MNLRLIIISIVVGILILSFLIYYLSTIKKRKGKKELRKRILAERIDNSKTARNIVFGITKGKQLYKRLISQVYPDNFPQDKFPEDKREVATLLSQRIVCAKRDYNELLKLEIEVEQFINSNT